jgi:hypothetical protein
MSIVTHVGERATWPDLPAVDNYLASRRECMWVASRFASGDPQAADRNWGAAFLRAGAVSAIRVPCLTWAEVSDWFEINCEPLIDLERVVSGGTPDLFLLLAGWNKPLPTPKRRSSVYFIQQGSSGPVKIGKADQVASRLATLQTANPLPLRLLATTDGGEARERELHAQFATDRMHGEWFYPSPALMGFIARLGATS